LLPEEVHSIAIILQIRKTHQAKLPVGYVFDEIIDEEGCESSHDSDDPAQHPDPDGGASMITLARLNLFVTGMYLQ
jgi:hypothetical protein